MKKKTLMILLTAMLALAMTMAFTACGDSGSGGDGESASSADGITIFNSKNEIQDEFEKLAATYTEQTGVPVEVYYSQDGDYNPISAN